ncbi:MAG: ATP synthase F1 subunit delta [Planctomycetales bacterium 12-60-4]|nr:MAG: ATP synthase F1 subunit delta [Planctomycetales bacterium 12-60-4]
MTAADSSNQLPSVMEDPSVQKVAKVYAVSLLDAASKTGEVDSAIEEFSSFVQDVLNAQPEFERLLCTSMTSLEAKLGLIDRVLAPRATPLFVSLLKVLAHHERLDIVRAVHAAAVLEYERRTGRVRVQVTSAVPLSASVLESLQQRLAQSMAATPILLPAVDPQLLGGLVIRVGDTVYDGSVRNRLRQLRGKLRERCLNEVQRGRDRFSHPAGN